MLDAVTGAYSFTGRAIARRLLTHGREVVTLVRRPAPPDADPRIRPIPFPTTDRAALVASLTGVDTLYNTLWIRFERGDVTFERSITDTRLLLGAAREAGVRRLVHVSVVNASPDAPTEYFRAKARLEDDVRASGLSWVIVRPTLTYGPGDILVNNLSWVLRRFPAFAIPGNGRYRLQPVHVDDVAAIAVGAAPDDEIRTLDAAGPETLAFDDFVGLLADAVGSRALRVHVPPRLSRLGSQVIGLLVRDVVLTADEVTELMASLLVSAEPPAGQIRLSEWVRASAEMLGRSYHSELDRHYRVPPGA
jgi:uncharacterized protein YbjT (DUF2867 family)